MYVFGFDIPLMEILFVFSLLYIVALIFTLVEIRKLRGIIMLEKADLRELRNDLSELSRMFQQERQ